MPPYVQFGESCWFRGGNTIFNQHIDQTKNECDGGYCQQSTLTCVPFNGEGGLGDACNQNEQCSSGSCLVGVCSTATATQLVGEDCELHTDCSGGACEPRYGCIGADGSMAEGEFCTEDRQCQGDLVCVTHYDATYLVDLPQNACAPPPLALGDTCAEHGDKNPCERGFCAGSPGHYRCTLPDGHGRMGDYCDHDNQCASLKCNLEAETCEAHGPLGLGEHCSEDTSCQYGRCDRANWPSRCIPNDGTGIAGDYCTHQNHCRSGLLCNTSTSECAEPQSGSSGGSPTGATHTQAEL